MLSKCSVAHLLQQEKKKLDECKKVHHTGLEQHGRE